MKTKNPKNICVIGTGYVGLVGAAIFADWGNTVVGVDIDENKIKRIESGDIPIYEPGLDEIVLRNVREGRLTFTTSLAEGIKNAEIVFVCVGTPQSDTGHADLTYVLNVAQDIGKLLKPKDYKVIVTKSTVPVGTNERVKKIITEASNGDAEFDVASNPEFLAEGRSVEDMKNPDRTVVGSDSERALEVLSEFYAHLNAPLVACDLRSAEMIKYASNAMLATKISFINEIGQLCERAGADVSVVAEGIGHDKRIGRAFLNASIGYGGSCFPKDVAALYKTSTDQAYDFKLLRSVMEVNELQRYYFVRKITKLYGENLSNVTFACLGLAFKSDTDDVRESVAIKIIQMLRGYGAKIRAYDPVAAKNAQKVLGDKDIVYFDNLYETVSGANAVCLLSYWKEFSEIDFDKVKSLMVGENKVVLNGDIRNKVDQGQIEDLGLVYFTIGKRTAAYDEKGDIIFSAVLRNGH